MAKDSTKIGEVAELDKGSGQVNRIVLPSSPPVWTWILCAESVPDPDDPEKTVKCGAVVDGVEDDDGTAQRIVDKVIKDRDPETYVCRFGHDGKLEIAE